MCPCVFGSYTSVCVCVCVCVCVRDYGRKLAMQALHKAVCRVYSTSQWDAENTTRGLRNRPPPAMRPKCGYKPISPLAHP